MRKKLLIAVLIVVVLLGVLWVLPYPVVFSKTVLIDRPYQPFERSVVNLKTWDKWWPGKRVADSVFEYNGQQLHIDLVLLNGFQASTIGDSSKRYVFQFTPQAGSKTSITFATVDYTGSNPFSKAAGYLRYFSRRSEISTWVDSVKSFFADTKKLYGMDVTRTRVTDPSLIALKQYFDHEPSVAEVYGLIAELRAYIVSQGGKETNRPMVNMYKETENMYMAMVAIATNKELPATDRYLLKRMELGYILTGTVIGGPALVKQGEENLSLYARDYSKVAPAIPYQLWVTDRMLQPDTAQWETKLYYPIFY
jgi:hypothetical protein